MFCPQNWLMDFLEKWSDLLIFYRAIVTWSKIASLTKYHCIILSMQQISSVHQFILQKHSFLNLYYQAKISLFHLFVLEIQPTLECQASKPIFDHAHSIQKNFNQLSYITNLYKQTKTQIISSFSSRDMVDLKILQSDSGWPAIIFLKK